MSGLVLRLCECRVGLLVKAANNIIFFNQLSRSFVRPETSPDLTRKHSGGTKNKTKEKMKRRTNKLKQKLKNLLLQNLELLILIVL